MERRPHSSAVGKPAPTDAELIARIGQRTGALEAFVRRLPELEKVWSSDRPASQFGTDPEQSWTATGDGVTATFALAGRITTDAFRYRVTVGGVPQPPIAAYSQPVAFAAIVFTAAPLMF